jgi:SAM-dependent methyltransferase
VLGPEATDWLSALGILDSAGKVRASMAVKHRQIGRYGEILQSLVREVRWPGEEPPGFVDMGCGKGYLTFAAWHLLHRHLRLPARVVGIEQRADLVDFGNAVARQVGAEGLEFRGGSIAEVPLPRLDALIALHACDTATDDAILRGVRAGAQLIVVAPCCHQQLRPQLTPPPLLAPIARHGLMAERLADWLTDGLRALHLQAAGYRTKVIEFVSPGHTPKNLMIAAVRHPAALPSAEIRSRVQALKSEYGIRCHALDALLTA